MKTRAVVSLLFLVSTAAVFGETLPYYNSPEFTPHWYESGDVELEDFHQIPSFSFVDQSGQEITEGFFEDKIYIASFFFTTCPGICPTVRSKLNRVQDSFIEDPEIKILQHSILPSSDTVEVLREYAERNQLESSIWHLVTGDRDEIYDLAKSAYFASDDLGNVQNTDDFLHTENLLLIDKNRNIRGVYNGLSNASVGYLIDDIRILKSED